jgi:hypothetical protein
MEEKARAGTPSESERKQTSRSITSLDDPSFYLLLILFRRKDCSIKSTKLKVKGILFFEEEEEEENNE